MIPAATLTPLQRWSALWVLFFAQMCSIGLVSYGYGLLIKPLSEEFGLSRVQAGRGLQLWLLGTAIWSPLVGIAVQRLAPHLVVAAGALLFGSGMIIAASSNMLAVSGAATLLLIASGAAALGPVVGSPLVARWFPTHQGRALGVITVSGSAGGFLLVPILAVSMQHLSWRGTVFTSGVLIGACILLLAFTLLRSLPGQSDSKASRSHQHVGDKSLSGRQLLRTRDFWLLIFIVGAVLGITQGLLTSIIPYSQDQGLTAGQAASLVSVISGSAVAGKLLTGWLSEWVDPRWLQIAAAGLMAAFFLIILTHPPFSAMLVACLFAGASIGATTLLWVVLVRGRFGIGSIGPVMGCMMLFLMPFQLGSIQIVGMVFDRWQSYLPAYTGFLLLLPFVVLSVLLMRGPAGDPVVQQDRPRYLR